MHHPVDGSSPSQRPPRLTSGGGRLVGAALVAAAGGALTGWLVPRGPVTTPEAVVTLVVAVGIGVAAGMLLRSRWAMLLAPVVFVALFELVRLPVDGPTVDAVSLDGLYGVIALVGGRGVDSLLMVLPMVVGAAHGAAWSRRSGPAPSRVTWGRWFRRGSLALATVAVLVLGVGLLRPASTEPVVGADGRELRGSIAELVDVPVGGHDQAIMLRGRSTESPVLLFLEGGPGGTGIGRIRNSGEDLEQEFVVATWDQRGTGKSYDALEPTSTMTLDRMVQDTLEVVDYLRQRFDEQRVYLVGSSWGTVIGTLAVQQSPEVFHAYVGTGQMVDPFATDKLMYAESVADAEARGDAGAVEALEEIGEPPYEDTLDYPVAVSSNPKWMDFPHGADYDPAAEYPASLFVGEYTLIEQLRGMAAIAETYDVLYPQLASTDFRTDVPRLQVPVVIVEGRYEAAGRETLAREWFETLSAPAKRYLYFENSGHTPPYDEPGRFAELMNEIQDETGERDP